MGIQDLQALVEGEGVSVDLFRIGRDHAGGLRLLLDAEGCLDRLYGGYFSDWACGGQWARAVQFVLTLKTALQEHRVSVCVCFDGASSAHPSAAWAQRQAAARQRVNSVLRHVASKGTPPPKVWWVPPAGLRACLRNALRHLNLPAMVSAEDHHREVAALCRERGYAGIVGCAGEYLAFRPPRYFCSSRLKLTYRSSLETKEHMVHDLAQRLGVPQERICAVAALLGNDELTEQHLADFHRRLSDDRKKPTGDELVRAVAARVKGPPGESADSLCDDVFPDPADQRRDLLRRVLRYYADGTKEGFAESKATAGRKPKARKGSDAPKLASESDALQIGEFEPVPGERRDDDSRSDSTVEGKDAKTPYPIEVLRTCTERHSKGLMTPSLLGILTRRRITLPVLLEEENHRDLPSVHHMFRPIRQNVYAVVFNMHHYHFMATKAKDGEKIAPPQPVEVAEWLYTRRNPGKTPEIVPGVMLDWPVPTVQRLWFGTTQDDKCRRMRAFLSCMRSENSLMTNSSYVPEHLLILATVLRYVMTSPSLCLRRHELDAFLATAFSTDLLNPLLLQEMTLSGVTVRGVQLGAMLMTGIDAALLANDACGAPVWWPFASPWMFFDGKLFQQKLAKANAVKNLVQLCDNQVDVVIKVERLRKAILEGLDVEFAAPPLPLNPNVLNMGYPPPGVLNWTGPAKSRGGTNSSHRGGGGRLEIAGVVVGQWGANYPRSAPTGRYGTTQIGYPAYAQNGTFGGRGRGRGRGTAVVGRGAPARRARHRATRPSGVRRRPDANSPSVNGKLPNEDSKNCRERVDDSRSDFAADCRNERSSDDGESPEPSADAKGKSIKVKKNAPKGKKRGQNKTDAEPNGRAADPGAKNKIAIKPVPTVNGSNGTNGERASQSDSPLCE